jgi:RNA polymerase subunit RPABC4/transcription elongation factor Spt4
METNYIYDLILPYFTGREDLCPPLGYVHNGGDGYVYATDGHILIRVPVEKVTKLYEAIKGYPKAGDKMRVAIEKAGDKTATIDTADLVRVLAGLSWHRVMTSDECPQCDGKGEYERECECEYCGSVYEEAAAKCPNCGGTGEVNLRIKEFSLLKSDDRYGIKIGDEVYWADPIQRVVIAALALQAERITYRIPDKKADAGVFHFAGIDIMLVRILHFSDWVVLALK